MAGMMTGLLLLLLVGVTVGRVVDLQKRIFGGQECAATERLYHVRLRLNNGGLCGGSLINKDWILTAGHCVPEGSTISVTAVLRVHPVGAIKKTVDINIKEIERYKDSKGTHDIALLKLPASETGFETASLPDCENPLTKGKTVQIAGHATTERQDANTDVNGRSKTLQCANTEVIDCVHPSCANQHYYDPQKIFCSKKAGVGIRNGDSGGGVMYNDMIYGVIVSFCKEEDEAIDVCKYKDWIEKFIKPVTPVKTE